MLTNEEQSIILTDELEKANAMIDWLAQVCEELSVELCEYPKYQCPKLKSDWINEAEKAVKDADRT